MTSMSILHGVDDVLFCSRHLEAGYYDWYCENWAAVLLGLPSLMPQNRGFLVCREARSFLFASTNSRLVALTPPELSDALIMPSISSSPLLTAMVFSRSGGKGPYFCPASDSLPYCFGRLPFPFISMLKAIPSGGGCWAFCCSAFCCSFEGRGKGGGPSPLLYPP
ncbi:unnamed protein product [Coccothraustes coccothraustes]